MSWAELYDDALTAAAWACAATGGTWPITVGVDNSPACVACLLGFLVAGHDVLLLESGNSYFGDERAPVHRLASATVVGPRGAAWMPDRIHFDEVLACRIAIGDAPVGGRGVAGGRNPAILQMTSGSTGETKIANQTLQNMLRGGEMYRGLFRMTRADSILAPVPLAHSFGLIGGLASTLVSGARLVTSARFELRSLQNALLNGTTIILGTPLLYELVSAALVMDPGRTSLRAMLSSGGPMSSALETKARRQFGLPIWQIYGSTETGIIACQHGRLRTWPDGCAGRPVPGVAWRIVPDGTRDISDGTGRLLVRTSTMFSGYVPAPTLSPMLADGFYDTGDKAWIDKDGNLFVVGRKDTFVNIGGRKVNPSRIERLILESSRGVREAFVYGCDGRSEDEELHAALVVAPHARLEEVLDECRRRMMPYEVPRHVRIVPRLPRTGMGKVDLPALLRLVAKQGYTAPAKRH